MIDSVVELSDDEKNEIDSEIGKIDDLSFSQEILEAEFGHKKPEAEIKPKKRLDVLIDPMRGATVKIRMPLTVKATDKLIRLKGRRIYITGHWDLRIPRAEVETALLNLSPLTIATGEQAGVEDATKQWSWRNKRPVRVYPRFYFDPRRGKVKMERANRLKEIFDHYKPNLVVLFPGGQEVALAAKEAIARGIEIVGIGFATSDPEFQKYQNFLEQGRRASRRIYHEKVKPALIEKYGPEDLRAGERIGDARRRAKREAKKYEKFLAKAEAPPKPKPPGLREQARNRKFDASVVSIGEDWPRKILSEEDIKIANILKKAQKRR